MFDFTILAPWHRARNLHATRRLAVAMWLFLTAIASADIQGPGVDDKDRKKPVRDESLRRVIEIPTPKDATYTVLRGQPVEIFLDATSGLRQPIEFRLTTQPRAGTLSGFRQVTNERVAVTYTAAAGQATQDVFTFRVKHRDSAASASATVRLMIVDPKPQLVVPESLDLGNVVVGETVIRNFVVENKGTAAYSAAIDLPPPWTLVTGGEPLTIPAGGKVEAKVAVRPTQPGPVTGVLNYPGDHGPGTKLAALGTAPLKVEPATLPAKWQAEDRTRAAELTLTNISASPLEYEVSAVARVTISPNLGTLEPHARQTIKVSLPVTDPAELNTLITINARGTRIEVPFLAEAAPPWLRLHGTEKITQEGDVYVLPSEGEFGTFILENAGGEAAVLQATVPEGLALIGFENKAVLPPGATRRLALRITREGTIEGELETHLGDQQLRFPLRTPDPSTLPPSAPTETTTSGSATSKPEASRNTAAEAQRALMTMDVVGVFPAEINIDSSLPELPHYAPKKLTPTRFEMTFPNMGSEYGYAIFREEYRPAKNGGRPLRYWIPWEGAKFSPAGQDIAATLDYLTPGRKYIIRFAVRTTDGRIGPPSLPQKFTTPLERPWPWKWFLGIVALIGAGWLGWRRWKLQYE